MKKLVVAVLCILLASPALALGATVDSSAPIQKDIASVSPQAANIAHPVFSTLDSLRSSLATLLDSQLTFAKTKLASTPKPTVTNVSATKDAAVSNPWGMLWFALYTMYFYLLSALRFAVGTALVFYPLFLVLVLYILWRAYRWWRAR